MMIRRNPHQQFKSKKAKAARKQRKRKNTSREVSNMNSSQVSFMGSQTITTTRDNSMTIITISIGIQLLTDMGRNNSFTNLLLRNTGSNNTTSQTTCSISKENPYTKWITIVTQWNPTNLRKNSPNSLATSSFLRVSAPFRRVLSLTPTTSTKGTL